MEVNMINKIPSRQTPVYHLSKGDVRRTIQIDLYDGLEVNNIPGTSTIRIRYRLQDGTISSFDATAGYDTNTLYVQVPGEVAAVPGPVYCKLVVNGVGYKAFFIEVEGI